MKRSAMIIVWLVLLSGACCADLDSIEGAAPWGVVTVTVDKEAGKHFPLIGWVAEPSRYSGTHGFILRLLIDKEDDTYDTKGCLRASFYVSSASGNRIRTAAVMSDDKRSHAMRRPLRGPGRVREPLMGHSPLSMLAVTLGHCWSGQ